MTRERGRGEVERLIRDGKLERVTPAPGVALRLLDDGAAHTQLAAAGIETDPSGALQLSYDAARKACTALLALQGLRATTRGGHVAVIDAVRVQFGGEGAMAVFATLHRLRRRRNSAEYPREDSPAITAEDARRALDGAHAALEAARSLMASGRLGPFS